ncbi:MAG: glycosyltransferase family 2 protein [Phycisphaerales bacterium]|nr:glycosyltransferase family 2 protein [Phycisphaerales bacterium]
MSRRKNILIGIPVYNEAAFVTEVLEEVRQYADDILVIDDGSTDSTARLLSEQPVKVVRHSTNRGYGRSTRDMIRWAAEDGFEWLITMDCDRQHEPATIPVFADRIACDDVDVISGSRYLVEHDGDDSPPEDRQNINRQITEELNHRLDLKLTDAFCGFKAYRISACKSLRLDVDGYDFPMQFWVRAVAAGLKIDELPVRLIYNDPSRSFGGPLDDSRRRLRIYQSTLHEELIRCANSLPAVASSGLGLDDPNLHE